MKKNKTGIIAALIVIALLSIGAVVDYLAPVVCWNMASLRALTPNESKPAFVLGYYSPGDGGHGWYAVTNTTTGTNAYGGRVLALGGAKSWQLLPENGRIVTRQFGVFPSTNDNSAVIDKLFEYCAANGFTSLVGTGEHYMTNSAYFRNNTWIDGEPNAWIVRNWTSPIDTRYAMLSVLGDLWPNNYLDTNVTTFDIVATNIVIKNVGLKASSTNAVGFPLAISNAKGVVVDGVKIGLCGYAWGITFLAENISIRNCFIDTTGSGTAKTIYTDGIHGIGATNFNISDNFIITGDDSIALSSLGTIGFANGLIENNTVFSYRGHGIRMQQDRPYSYAVWTNITWRGMNGTVGLDANGGILIQNLNTNAWYYPFRNITIADVKLNVGNLSTQGGGTNYSGGNRAVFVNGFENLLVENVSVTQTAFESFDFEKGLNGVLRNCRGAGAEWWFRNATIRLDSVTNFAVFGGDYYTLSTSIVSNSVPLYVVGSQDIFVQHSNLTNQNANAAAILLGGSQSGFVSLIGNKMASATYGIQSVINPTSIIVLGNKVEAPTPAQWQGSAPPVSSVIANNLGLSSLGVVTGSELNVMNTSSGTFMNGLDARANYEARWTSTNGVFFLAQDKINGGTKTVRFGAQPSSSSGKPTIIAAATDNASFPLVFLGYGSSLMDAAPWVNFGAAPTPYSAGVYLGNWTSTGMKIEPGGAPGSQAASSALEVRATTQGLLVTPITKTQRNAIASPANGLVIYQSDSGNYGPRWYSTTLGGWMKADGTADP